MPDFVWLWLFFISILIVGFAWYVREHSLGTHHKARRAICVLLMIIFIPLLIVSGIITIGTNG